MYGDDIQSQMNYAFVSGGLDIGGALVTTGGNYLLQQDAQKHADQASLEAYNRDIAMWKMRNEYESPLNRRLRLEKAGISPWTAFGQMTGESGNVKANVADTIDPARFEMPELDMFGKYLSLKKLANENKALEQTINNQKAEEEAIKLKNDAMKFWYDNEMIRDSNFKKAMQDKDLATVNTAIEFEKERLNQMRWEVIKLQNENDQFQWSKGMRKYDEAYRIGQLKEQNAQIANIWQNIEKSRADISYMETQKENLKADLGLKQKEGLMKDFEIERNKWRSDAIKFEGIDPANLDMPSRLIKMFENRVFNSLNTVKNKTTTDTITRVYNPKTKQWEFPPNFKLKHY